MWCILLSFGLQLLPCCTMHVLFWFMLGLTCSLHRIHLHVGLVFPCLFLGLWILVFLSFAWLFLLFFIGGVSVVCGSSVYGDMHFFNVPWNGLWCLFSWRGWLSWYGGIGRKLLPSHVIASMNPYMHCHWSHIHMHYHGFLLLLYMFAFCASHLPPWPSGLAWLPLCRYWSAFLMARAFSALCCVALRSLSVHVCFLGFLLLF